VPRAVTVWAVELGKEVEPDEIKGTLELSDQALLFSPDEEARPTMRISLHDIAKVQVYCAWAEVILGEAPFSTAVK